MRGGIDTAPHHHFRFAQRCSNRVPVHETQEARLPTPSAEDLSARHRPSLTPKCLASRGSAPAGSSPIRTEGLAGPRHSTSGALFVRASQARILRLTAFVSLHGHSSDRWPAGLSRTCATSKTDWVRLKEIGVSRLERHFKTSHAARRNRGGPGNDPTLGNPPARNAGEPCLDGARGERHRTLGSSEEPSLC